MIEIPVVNMQGKRVGSETIDPAILGGAVRPQLLKQAIVAYRASQRQGTVRQKTRAEVHGAGRKLYRQKGTGRARMGNIRTPTRRGGGRAFPRRPNDFSMDLPRQMRRLARNSAVLAKLQAGAAVILDELKFDEPKTKKFFAVLQALDATKGCLLALPSNDPAIWRAGRNIPTLDLRAVTQLNAYEVLRRRKLVFVRDAFKSFVASCAASAT
ncbi:MAG: 50S ribosomal protein L4 [Phycisphaerae bacterium]|nr:50S ribosomal protein L4 [Phycisphaerae bacterium]